MVVFRLSLIHDGSISCGRFRFVRGEAGAPFRRAGHHGHLDATGPYLLLSDIFDRILEDRLVQETLGHPIRCHPGQRKVAGVALAKNHGLEGALTEKDHNTKNGHDPSRERAR